MFLGLIAAAAHDVDHPGVNQPFLIKTRHHLAALYQVHAGAQSDVSTLILCSNQELKVQSVIISSIQGGDSRTKVTERHVAAHFLSKPGGRLFMILHLK